MCLQRGARLWARRQQPERLAQAGGGVLHQRNHVPLQLALLDPPVRPPRQRAGDRHGERPDADRDPGMLRHFDRPYSGLMPTSPTTLRQTSSCAFTNALNSSGVEPRGSNASLTTRFGQKRSLTGTRLTHSL